MGRGEKVFSFQFSVGSWQLGNTTGKSQMANGKFKISEGKKLPHS